MSIQYTIRWQYGPVLLLLVSACGCMHPGMYYGYPHGQPVYAPPRTLNPGPGTLVIPESKSNPYTPGLEGTYDSSPAGDDFRRSDDSDVPFPEEPGRAPFYGEDDLGVSVDPRSGGSALSARPVATVSAVDRGLEYSFDTASFRWLQGVVTRSPLSGEWRLTYSTVANDRYLGSLPLDVKAVDSSRLYDGALLFVEGRPDETANGTVYRVSGMQLVATGG